MSEAEVKSPEQIQAMLDSDINKVIATHKGHIKVINRVGNVVQVEMSGGCQGCAGARYTLNLMVTETIKEFDPTVESIEDVTNHSAGQNPFYPKEK